MPPQPQKHKCEINTKNAPLLLDQDLDVCYSRWHGSVGHQSGHLLRIHAIVSRSSLLQVQSENELRFIKEGKTVAGNHKYKDKPGGGRQGSYSLATATILVWLKWGDIGNELSYIKRRSVPCPKRVLVTISKL